MGWHILKQKIVELSHMHMTQLHFGIVYFCLAYMHYCSGTSDCLTSPCNFPAKVMTSVVC